MSNDPWADLTIPELENSISARRVSEDTKWNFYWGRDRDRRCLLVLRHDLASSPRERLPHLKGVDVLIQPGADEIRPSLILRLLDNSLRDIFYRLCLDVIASTSDKNSEVEAVTTTVARTWRWHHLLRGGVTGLLTPEEQKGLIGELLVLDKYFLPVLSGAESLNCWLGPIGAAQDFVCGRVAIESKARSNRGSDEVYVSSEYQLDDGDFSSLYLHVSVFEREENADDGFTIADVVKRIRDKLTAGGETICEQYTALLAAAGYRDEDDYSGFRWTGGERSIFKTGRDFPRLIPSEMPKAVKGVKYMLSLADCSAFVVSPSAVITDLASSRA